MIWDKFFSKKKLYKERSIDSVNKRVFTYFVDPDNFANTEKNCSCDLCKQKSDYCLNVEDYELDRKLKVCYDCVLNGRLEELEIKLNNILYPHIDKEYLANLKKIFPKLSNKELESKYLDQSRILTYLTPALVTWQDLYWPYHCGDYCEYLQMAGTEDLNEFVTNSDGKGFLEKHLTPDSLGWTIDELWSSLKPGTMKNFNDNWSPTAYIFRCLTCKEYFIHVDSH